jgi:shikimate kinase
LSRIGWWREVLNVALYGFMGVGKSTVGKALSERLGYGFVDMDEMIERRAGAKIKDIFATEGEKGFRALEKEVAKEVGKRDRHVIACGGGAVLDPENAEALRSNSVLVLLTASIDEIMERTRKSDVRPLLNVDDARAEAEALLRERMPLYLEAADLVMDTAGASPTQLAAEIAAALEEST